VVFSDGGADRLLKLLNSLSCVIVPDKNTYDYDVLVKGKQVVHNVRDGVITFWGANLAYSRHRVQFYLHRRLRRQTERSAPLFGDRTEILESFWFTELVTRISSDGMPLRYIRRGDYSKLLKDEEVNAALLSTGAVGQLKPQSPNKGGSRDTFLSEKTAYQFRFQFDQAHADDLFLFGETAINGVNHGVHLLTPRDWRKASQQLTNRQLNELIGETVFQENLLLASGSNWLPLTPGTQQFQPERNRQLVWARRKRDGNIYYKGGRHYGKSTSAEPGEFISELEAYTRGYLLSKENQNVLTPAQRNWHKWLLRRSARVENNGFEITIGFDNPLEEHFEWMATQKGPAPWKLKEARAIHGYEHLTNYEKRMVREIEKVTEQKDGTLFMEKSYGLKKGDQWKIKKRSFRWYLSLKDKNKIVLGKNLDWKVTDKDLASKALKLCIDNVRSIDRSTTTTAKTGKWFKWVVAAHICRWMGGTTKDDLRSEDWLGSLPRTNVPSSFYVPLHVVNIDVKDDSYNDEDYQPYEDAHVEEVPPPTPIPPNENEARKIGFVSEVPNGKSDDLTLIQKRMKQDEVLESERKTCDETLSVDGKVERNYNKDDVELDEEESRKGRSRLI
jgi:hypothetical protein